MGYFCCFFFHVVKSIFTILQAKFVNLVKINFKYVVVLKFTRWNIFLTTRCIITDFTFGQLDEHNLLLLSSW